MWRFRVAAQRRVSSSALLRKPALEVVDLAGRQSQLRDSRAKLASADKSVGAAGKVPAPRDVVNWSL